MAISLRGAPNIQVLATLKGGAGPLLPVVGSSGCEPRALRIDRLATQGPTAIGVIIGGETAVDGGPQQDAGDGLREGADANRRVSEQVASRRDKRGTTVRGEISDCADPFTKVDAEGVTSQGD